MLSKASITSDLASSQPQPTAVSELNARVSEKETKGRHPAEPFVLQTETLLQFQSNEKGGATKAACNEFLTEVVEEGCIKTLPVDVETDTQLLTCEVQQETQLIDGNTVHSDVEASGDTELLADDVDIKGDCEELESGFTLCDIKLRDGNQPFLLGTSTVGLSEMRSGLMQHVSSNEEARQIKEATKSGAKLGITTGIVSTRLRNGDFNTAEKSEESLDSDATTEEGEMEDAGNSETVMQSRPPEDNVHIEGGSSRQVSKPEQLLPAKKEGSEILAHSASQMEKGCSGNFPQEVVEIIHGVKEAQCMNQKKQDALPLPCGFVSAATNLSYVESQEPGEESQLNALNIVDKLVWMNATGMSQDTELIMAPQSPRGKVSRSGKGVQNLAHTSEVKNRQAKIGVYNWVDSQQDEDGFISDIKELSGPSRARRKRPGIPRLIKERKNQTGSEQQKPKSGLQATNKKDLRIHQKKVTPGSIIGQMIASKIKSTTDSEHVTESETLQTVHVTNRSTMASVQTEKTSNVSCKKNIPSKNREPKKSIKTSRKKNDHMSSIGTHHTVAGNEEHLELHLGVENKREGKVVEPCREHDIGSDTQVAIEAIDMMRQELLFEQCPVEKGSANSKSHQHDANKRSNIKEPRPRKTSASKDDTEHLVRHQTRSKVTESAPVSQCEGKKQVSRRCSLEEQHQCNIERKEESVKKIPKAKPILPDFAVVLASNSTDEPQGAKSVTNIGTAHRKSKRTCSSKQSRKAKLNVVVHDELSVRTVESNVKTRRRTQRELTRNLHQVDVINEVDVGVKTTSNSSAALVSIDEQRPVSGVSIKPQGCKTWSKRKREADSSGSHKLQIQEHLPTPKYDISTQPLSRRARGRNVLLAEGQEIPDGKATLVNMGRRRTSQVKDVDSDKHVAVPATVIANTNKGKMMRQKKKRAGLEIFTQSGFWPIVQEGRRRKREPGCIHVLFTHSFPEDTIKHQKKILAKLGGHLAMSAVDCTHFVIDNFVRTRNMLESMAAGKAIVTSQWLETCGQVHFFVDEKNYILQDAKKEKELGFSMRSSLAAAQQKPILKGMKVLISPNTVPDFEAMNAIIEAAGGKAAENMSSFSKVDATNNETVSIVIASEKDYEFCLPFLEKGFKAYSTEFILIGIVLQNLDFSRNQLFHRY